MSFPLKNLVGNHKSARPIVYKGVRYPSRRALAAALGISVVTLRSACASAPRWSLQQSFRWSSSANGQRNPN